MIDIEKTERELSKAQSAVRRGKQYIPDVTCLLKDANEPFECWEVLHKIGEALDCLYMLTDDYYRDYIWNACGETASQLKKNGLDDDNLYLDMAGKLETFRAIVFGHNADWESIESEMYDDLLQHEVVNHRYYKEMWDDCVIQRDRLSQKVRELEKGGGKND